MARCLIGLGANLGDRAATLKAALRELAADDVHVLQVSAIHSTPAIGGSAPQPDFLNAAAVLETGLDPELLLARLLDVETRLGRKRDELWGARLIDLDLLLYEDLVLSRPQLVVPHPRLVVRWFAAAPAAEIAPQWVHPQLGWTLEDLRQHIATAPNYAALCGLRPSEQTALARRALEQVPGDVISDRGLCDQRMKPLEQQLCQAGLLGPWDPREYPPHGEAWLVSDFWMEQAIAHARAEQAAADVVEDQFAVLAPSVPKPKLLVYLMAAPTTEELPLFRELEQQLTAPNRGPVLRVTADDADWAQRELVAALRAMRPDARL